MKISSITLSAFRSHVKTAITGLSDVNIFVGPNGAGKTTILDAIGYALTGVCRGVDEGGRGADALASQIPGRPEGSTSVSLKTSKGDILRGLGQGPRSQAHVKIVTKLALDEKILRVLAAPMNLLRLDRKKQEEVFFSLTGSGITGEAVKAALLQDGCDVSIDCESLTTPEGRADALKFYKTRRVELKREIADLVFVPSDKKLPEYDEEVMQDCMSKSASLRQDMASGRGAAEQAIKSGAHLRGLLETAQSKLAGLVEGNLADEVLGKDQLDGIRKSIDRRRLLGEDLAVERSKYEAASQEIRGLAEEIQRVLKFGAECPECGQAIDPSYTEHRANDLRRAHAKAVEDAAIIEAKRKKIEADMGKVDVNTLLAQISRSERAAQAIKSIQKERAGLVDQVNDLVARINDLTIPEAKDWSKHEAQISELQDKAMAMQEAKSEQERAAQVNRAREVKESELARVEKLVKAIGPSGVIMQMMASDGTAEMVKSVKQYGEALGVGEISIAFGPWQIFLNGRPIELASASEEFRVAAAFGIAFSVKAGASILCLDGAEILFGEFRKQFQDLVFSCGLDQVFVACTTESVAESAPAVDGLAMFSVAKDLIGRSTVNEIKQEASA